jgi:hypothetical protein
MDRIFEVTATPDQVWQLVADLGRVLASTEPQTTVSMEGGDRPVKQGTVFHLTTRSGLKSDWTVLSFIPPKQISHRIDLGVWDGGVSTVTLEPIESGTRVTLRTPTMPWPQTWAPVRYGTWPLVLRDAKRTGERFERAVRAYVAELASAE